MPRDVAEMVEQYLSEDPTRWAKLASNVQWRRLQLLLLRAILVELRKLTARLGAGLGQENRSQTTLSRPARHTLDDRDLETDRAV